jgi:hypothetical protein
MMSSQQPGLLDVGEGVGDGGGGGVDFVGFGLGPGPFVEDGDGGGVPVCDGAWVVVGTGAGTVLVGTALVVDVVAGGAVAGTMVTVPSGAVVVTALGEEDASPEVVHHGSSVSVLENSLPGRFGKTPDDIASSRQLSPEKRATPPTPASTMAARADSRSTRRRLARGGRAPESKDMGPKTRRIVRTAPPEPAAVPDG